MTRQVPAATGHLPPTRRQKGSTMPKHAKNPARREPVMLASAAAVVVTIAAFLGFDIDREAATGIVSLVILIVGAWARSRVTPTPTE